MMPESLLPIEEDKSCYASTMFDNDPVAVDWFREDLVMPRDWELEHPYDILPNASNRFVDYLPRLRALGFKAWNIENNHHATSYLKVSSLSNGTFITIGGRANYLITKNNVTRAEYLNRVLCVIEIQSKLNIQLCELLYLLILMNTKHLRALAGFLILTDGNCRAFKATRDDDHGGCIFEVE